MPRSRAAGGAAPLSASLRYDEVATMGAWENFVFGQATDAAGASGVRSLIEHSWRRSRERGIDAGGAAAPIHDDREELRQIAHKNAELLSAARPSFESVNALLEGTGAMLVLAAFDRREPLNPRASKKSNGSHADPRPDPTPIHT